MTIARLLGRCSRRGQVDVSEGQALEQGQKIGEISATGPHLDWRLNIGTSLCLDPQLVIPEK